jgi:HK97 family phage major capsid protein
MKLSLDEVKALASSLTGMTGKGRESIVSQLKSAAVHDLDKDGNEIAVEAEFVDEGKTATEPTKAQIVIPAEPKAAPVEDIDAKVTAKVDELLKARNAAAVINNRKVTPMQPDIRVVSGVSKAFKGEVAGKTASHRAHDFGQFVAALAGNAKAYDYCSTNGLITKHVEHTPERGGYLEPDEFLSDLIVLQSQRGVARQLSRVLPMSRDSLTIPRLASGFTGYWTGEGAAITQSAMGFDAVTLVAKKLSIASLVSSELFEDASIALGDLVAQQVAYAFADKEDHAYLDGDGTSTHGGIQGIRTRLAAINGTDDGGGLVLASGNAFSEVVLSDLTQVIGRVPSFAGPRSWLVSPAFYGAVMLRLAQANATRVEIDGIGMVDTFNGYPVFYSERMPTAAANSSIAALFGDFTQAVTLGTRRDLRLAISDSGSVGTTNAFATDNLAIRATQRLDINAHDLGDATNAGPVVGLILAGS